MNLPANVRLLLVVDGGIGVALQALEEEEAAALMEGRKGLHGKMELDLVLMHLVFNEH
jgi:hypothetical protein